MANIIRFPVERTRREKLSPVQQICERTRRKLAGMTSNKDIADFKQHQEELREMWRND